MTSLTADDRLALIKTFSFVREKRHNAKHLDELADRFDRLQARGGNGRTASTGGEVMLFSASVKTPLTLPVVLLHARLCAHFGRFVDEHYAGESLRFMAAVDNLGEGGERAVVDEFCRSASSPSLINVEHRLLAQIEGAAEEGGEELHALLRTARAHVLRLVEDNFFHLFLRQVVDVQDDPLLIAD